MPPQMWEKGAEGVGGRPDFGVSVAFPGPEPIPAALQPLLDGSCCAVTPELITQGPSPVHRPLNPALAAAASSLPPCWFCFSRQFCIMPGALLQLSVVALKSLL